VAAADGRPFLAAAPAPGLPPSLGTAPAGFAFAQFSNGSVPQLPSGPPAPPALQPGATPEQQEAYRRDCWRKYYEYCSLWQKYYTQNSTKAAQSKAKPRGPPGPLTGQVVGPPAVLPSQLLAAGKGGLGGMGGPLMPMPVAPPDPAAAAARGRSSAMAAWPLALAAGPGARPPQVVLPVRPEAVGKGRGGLVGAVQLPPVRSLIEDDIHSKLLGL